VGTTPQTLSRTQTMRFIPVNGSRMAPLPRSLSSLQMERSSIRHSQPACRDAGQGQGLLWVQPPCFPISMCVCLNASKPPARPQISNNCFTLTFVHTRPRGMPCHHYSHQSLFSLHSTPCFITVWLWTRNPVHSRLLITSRDVITAGAGSVCCARCRGH
jgi:hypothetical protein